MRKLVGSCGDAGIPHWPVGTFRRTSALVCLGMLLMLGQPNGQALSPAGRLAFARNYFLTGGNVVVAGKGMRGTGDSTGLATATLNLSGVPAGADIAAALLYWITIEGSDVPLLEQPNSLRPTFRGQPIYPKQIAPSGTRACWASGGGSGTTSGAQKLRVYFEDVLQHLPLETQNGVTRVKANGPHEVKLPDSGGGGTQAPSSGNQLTYTEGASLLVVYRIPDAPLRSVVIYDGGLTMDQDTPPMELEIAGFYGASQNPDAKMIHLVGNGDNKQERLFINGAQPMVLVDGSAVPQTNPFGGAEGSAWDNPSYPLPLAPAALTATTKVTSVLSAVDCLSWAAVAVSTGVQDTDGDGMPDAVEDGTVTVDPSGRLLPPFAAMGANKLVPDVWVEMGWMETKSDNNPWPASSGVGPHSHRPSRPALEMVAKAFKNAGINPHFDLGSHYQPTQTPNAQSCANAQTWTFDCAIVPATYARGGESIIESACVEDLTASPPKTCSFTQPGTVGWKRGYQRFRDAWVGADGAPLTEAQEIACEESPGSAGCIRRRFDPERMDFVHYVLWAHALGLPRSPFPCITPEGTGADYNNAGTCAPNAADPNFRIPGRFSGFGDKGGGDILITLAGFAFDRVMSDGSVVRDYNGADIVQAGTLIHELAHNFDRSHGGETLERNCKPNYISSANYLFQVHGIPMIVDGVATLGVDLSGQNLAPLSEDTLSDSALAPAGTVPQYGTRWYAPQATSFISSPSGFAVTPAAKHCDGSLKNPGDPDMVRVETLNAAEKIDWLNDGDTSDTSLLPQDINFDGALSATSSDPPDRFAGSDDWTYVKNHGLKQVGSRPNMGLLSLDVALADLGRGDPGRGDPGRGDPGRGDPGRGDPGRGDPGRGDPGRGDPGRGDPGAPPGDLDFDNLPVQGPQLLTASQVQKTVRLTWSAPYLIPEGVVIGNTYVYRVEGMTLTPANFAKRVLIGQTGFATPPVTSFVDPKPMNGRSYFYLVYSDFSGPNGTTVARSPVAISNRVNVRY